MKQEQKLEVITELYGNNIIKKKYQIIKDTDIKHGNYFFNFLNGNKKEKGDYVNGELNGQWVEFYEYGNIKEKSNYVNGKKHGKFVEFDEIGNVEKEEIWKNDELISVKKFQKS